MTAEERKAKSVEYIAQIEDWCRKFWNQYEGLHGRDRLCALIGPGLALTVAKAKGVTRNDWSTTYVSVAIDEPAVYIRDYWRDDDPSGFWMPDEYLKQPNNLLREHKDMSHIYTLLQNWPEVKSRLHESAKLAIAYHEERKAKEKAEVERKNFIIENFSV